MILLSPSRLTLFGALLFLPGFYFTVRFFSGFLRMLYRKLRKNRPYLKGSASDYLWFAVGSFALVPVVEEVFYRGYCQSRLASTRAVIQPLWVEDLATVLMWSLDNAATLNQTYEIGGSEYFTVRQIVEILMQVTHRPRVLFELHPVFMRALIVTLESFVPNYPASSFWLDYISINRTCPVDNLPRIFGLMPARFTYRLDYLKRTPWYSAAWDRVSTQTTKRTRRILEALRTFRP